MNKRNVLFITRDFSHFVDKSFYYLASELARPVNLMLWHEQGHIDDILKRVPVRPDFILLNDFRENECPPISGLDHLTLPYGAIVHDLHYRIEERKRYIADNRIKYLFTIYRDAFKQHYPEFCERMYWLPHFADTKVFMDYKQPKEIDVLMLGCTARKYYPFRRRMLDCLKNKEYFVYHEHPGYRNIDESDHGIMKTGIGYAREINRAKLFLTCDSVFHYPLRKYYEVLACKTLLLAPDSKELHDLGFINDHHFVAITEDDFLEKTEYYLHHDKERERIAEQGYRFIRSRHSAVRRAEELAHMIDTILDKHNESF